MCTPGLNTCTCATNADCDTYDDGNKCNGIYVCQDAHCVIKPDSAVLCDTSKDNVCSKAACNPSTGVCGQVSAVDGTVCDDTNACTTGETCKAGLCVPGSVLSCSDGNPCTDDDCYPTSGCTYATNTAICDDGDACTNGDACSNGVCIGGSYTCDCKSANAECTKFDDGNLCNGTYKCLSHKCVLDETTIVTCDTSADTACTKSTCAPATGKCQMAPASDGVACDDVDPCTTTDACYAGVCTGGAPLGCDDENPCTDDACAKGVGCQHVNNTSPCEDGNACTGSDACKDGACAAGPKTCQCEVTADCATIEDGDLCNGTLVCTNNACVVDPATVKSCDTSGDNEFKKTACDKATGQCVKDVKPDATGCSDNDACTTGDVCLQGQCVGSGFLDCNDLNPCTDDSCDKGKGCAHVNNTSPCDDANKCTLVDVCAGGLCKPGTLNPCNDNNPCTDDGCDPFTGCVNLPNTAPCDDGNACTTGDLCSGSSCQPGGPTACSDGNPCTDDACDKGKGCYATPNVLPCDDKNFCTTGDTCSNGACVPTGKLDCADKNACTADSCDPGKGCINAALDGTPCEDGNGCTVNDTCKAGLCMAGPGQISTDNNPCTDDACTPSTGCVFTNNSASCDDSDACTSGDTCSGGACVPGKPIVCNDLDLCTDDSCNPKAGCVYAHNTAPCDDASACTQGDVCSKGTCAGAPILCDDKNPCTDNGCNPKSGCTYANNTLPCDDGEVCTIKDTCAGGSCVGVTNPCDDKNPCTTDGCIKGLGCVSLPTSGVPCDDGNGCTMGDTCASGVCKGGTVDLCAPCVGQQEGAVCNDSDDVTIADLCLQGLCRGFYKKFFTPVAGASATRLMRGAVFDGKPHVLGFDTRASINHTWAGTLETSVNYVAYESTSDRVDTVYAGVSLQIAGGSGGRVSAFDPSSATWISSGNNPVEQAVNTGTPFANITDVWGGELVVGKQRAYYVAGRSSNAPLYKRCLVDLTSTPATTKCATVAANNPNNGVGPVSLFGWDVTTQKAYGPVYVTGRYAPNGGGSSLSIQRSLATSETDPFTLVVNNLNFNGQVNWTDMHGYSPTAVMAVGSSHAAEWYNGSAWQNITPVWNGWANATLNFRATWIGPSLAMMATTQLNFPANKQLAFLTLDRSKNTIAPNMAANLWIAHNLDSVPCAGWPTLCNQADPASDLRDIVVQGGHMWIVGYMPDPNAASAQKGIVYFRPGK